MDAIREMQVDAIVDGWGVARRDDTSIAQAVAEGEPIDAVHTLEDEAALDEFLQYLKVRAFVPLFEELGTAMRLQRVNVAPTTYIWLYFTKLMLGIKGMAKMSPLLLRDEALMRLLGFNAHQFANGVTRRGDSKRQPGTEREGPVSTEAVSNNIVKLSVLALARFFNGVIQRMVLLVIPEGPVDIVVDCSLYESTPKFEEATRTSRTVKTRDIHGKLVELRETHWGWKIGLAYHAPTGIPLALCVTKITTDDRAHFWTLVQDAKRNLGSRRIRSVAMDRGFLDGEDLWRLQEQSIEFAIPVKSDMNVYKDAVALAKRYGPDPLHPEVREERWQETRTVGHGKNATTETVATEIVGIPTLQTFDTYGPRGHGAKSDQKDFKPNAINAVVVSQWRGRRFKSPKVFVTNGEVTEPRLTFDRYDDRSTIENGLFREGKQAWSLENPPKRSGAGVTVHVYMTYVAMGLSRCYQMEVQGHGTQSTAAPPVPAAGPSRLRKPGPGAVPAATPNTQTGEPGARVTPASALTAQPVGPSAAQAPGSRVTPASAQIARPVEPRAGRTPGPRVTPAAIQNPRPVEPSAGRAPDPRVTPAATQTPQLVEPSAERAPGAVAPPSVATVAGRTLPTPRLNLGMESYRLDLKVQNRNKVILFRGDTYGILHIQEMAMLSGVNLLERSPGVGTREETFRKFGMEPPQRPVIVRTPARTGRRGKGKPPPRWFDDD